MNLDHSSSGKGDKSRTKFDHNWAERYDSINWILFAPDGFTRVGNQLHKRYPNKKHTSKI